MQKFQKSDLLSQGRARNLKKGEPQFPVSVSTENIGEDQKKVLASSDVQSTPQNHVKSKKIKRSARP